MKDPDFEGSLAQELGMDEDLCPTCEANLYDGVCLNGCGLRAMKAAFLQLITAALADRKEGRAA